MTKRARAGSVVFLGAGPWQQPFLRAGQRLGLDLFVLDGDPTAPGLALCPRHAVVNIADPEAVAGIVRQLRPQVVLTGAADVGVRTLATLAVTSPELPTFAPAPGDWRQLLQKDVVLSQLGRAGIEVPRHEVVTDLAAAEAAAARIGLPVMFKPTDGAGGRGVVRVGTMAESAAAFASAQGFARQGRVLVEALIDGPGLGFEGFVENGAVVFGTTLEESYTAGFPSPCGHAWPPTLPVPVQKRSAALAQAVVTALGIRRGPFNLDLRLRGETPVFIEINVRAGGAAISDLLRHSAGFDQAEATFKAALGIPVAPPAVPQRPAAVELLATAQGGLVESVEFDVHGLPVIDHAVHITPGSQRSAEVPWAGWVLTGGDDTVHAQAAAKTAAARLRVGFAGRRRKSA